MDRFLDAILERKRAAEAYGMRLDIIVLHREFYDTLMGALGQSSKASQAFELKQCRKESERKDIYLHGIKVMWSGDRLPRRQAWYRYTNPGYVKKL